MIFKEILEQVADRADGLQGAVVMGMDGIAIGEHILDPACSIQSAGIEYASAIRSIQNAARSLEAGDVQEVFIDTANGVFILRLITPEYFIAAALRPDGNHGKVRYLLRMAAPKLATEFA